MDAKKMLKQAMRDLERAKIRKSCGDVGGIKLLPTLVHGDMPPVRHNKLPIIQRGNRVNIEDYEDME